MDQLLIYANTMGIPIQQPDCVYATPSASCIITGTPVLNLLHGRRPSQPTILLIPIYVHILQACSSNR